MATTQKPGEVSATEMSTGECRVSFPQVWEPKAFRGGDSKFSCIFLIPKKDVKTVARVRGCIDAAILDGKVSKWKGIIPKSLDNPLHDGDEQFALGKKGEEFKGHFYINAKSNNKPWILDVDGQEMMKQTNFYAGCYARAAINFFPYDNAGQGVGVGLNGIKKTNDGVPFSGKPSLEKVQGMFDEDDDNEV